MRLLIGLLRRGSKGYANARRSERGCQQTQELDCLTAESAKSLIATNQ